MKALMKLVMLLLTVATLTGMTHDRIAAAPIQKATLLSGVSSVVAGNDFSCALLTTGGVKCWGANDWGQLGNGTTKRSLKAVQVKGLESGVASIHQGGRSMCALLKSNSLRCWGANGTGNLGDGTRTYRSIPVSVIGLEGIVQHYFTQGSHSCAITTTQALYCWGDNSAGQLGNGTLEESWEPVLVPELSENVKTVSLGNSHQCAVLTNGAAKCWGYNYDGVLGNGTKATEGPDIDPIEPVQVVGLSSGVEDIAVGGQHTCALLTSGAMRCWGNNQWGQLGDGTTTTRLTPRQVWGLTSDVKSMSLGYGTTCAVIGKGEVKCWGFNDKGRLGVGTNTQQSKPRSVAGISTGAKAVYTAASHTCAIFTNGGVRCWGYNDWGRLGDGTNAPRFVSVNVSGLASGVVNLAVGGSHTCVAMAAGNARCWGFNLWGQVGDGTTTHQYKPVLVQQ